MLIYLISLRHVGYVVVALLLSISYLLISAGCCPWMLAWPGIKHDLRMAVGGSWPWAWLPAMESNTIFFGSSQFGIGHQTRGLAQGQPGCGWPGLAAFRPPTKHALKFQILCREFYWCYRS
jgi:hypothetical protein